MDLNGGYVFCHCGNFLFSPPTYSVKAVDGYLYAQISVCHTAYTSPRFGFRPATQKDFFVSIYEQARGRTHYF